VTTVVGEHPAVAAWRALGPDHRAPSGVEALHAKNPARRCVYRLLHATEGDEPVIAKRYGTAAHEVERMVYRDDYQEELSRALTDPSWGSTN
jgi:hypothetical protein